MKNLASLFENSGITHPTSGILGEIYPFDPHTRTFTIPARLGQYADFFNPMDPSPAPARDLSLDLVEYLNQCSDEIPGKYPLTVSIEIQNEPQAARQEQECLESLRSFYQHAIFVTQANIRRKRRQALKYLLVSFTCLAIYIISEQWNLSTFFWNLLREAVLIGGWVFMWEAVTLNFIEMDSHIQEIKKYRRLINAQIRFSHDQFLENSAELPYPETK